MLGVVSPLFISITRLTRMLIPRTQSRCASDLELGRNEQIHEEGKLTETFASRF